MSLGFVSWLCSFNKDGVFGFILGPWSIWSQVLGHQSSEYLSVKNNIRTCHETFLNSFNFNKSQKVKAGAMFQQLRALSSLPEVLGLVIQDSHGDSKLPLTPVSVYSEREGGERECVPKMQTKYLYT